MESTNWIERSVESGLLMKLSLKVESYRLQWKKHWKWNSADCNEISIVSGLLQIAMKEVLKSGILQIAMKEVLKMDFYRLEWKKRWKWNSTDCDKIGIASGLLLIAIKLALQVDFYRLQ